MRERDTRSPAARRGRLRSSRQQIPARSQGPASAAAAQHLLDAFARIPGPTVGLVRAGTLAIRDKRHEVEIRKLRRIVDTKVAPMDFDQLQPDEPLSPELVLVLPPELRAQALASLGPPDWAKPKPRLRVVHTAPVAEAVRPAPVEEVLLAPSIGQILA